MSNPYSSRPVISANYFIAARGGRGVQAQRLLQHLGRDDPPPDSISLIGERRFGKTSILGYLQRAVPATPRVLVSSVDMLSLPQQGPDGFYSVLSHALQRAGALSSSASFLTNLDFVDFLQELRNAKRRLVVFIDEFDVVARDRRFNLTFFDNLRSAATLHPLTLVVASVAPLVEIAHADVLGSPFFNIFNKERLVSLSRQEAGALICQPPGGEQGVGEAAEGILALAGCHPYFLQRACGCAWELRAASGGRLDLAELRSAFEAAIHDHWQYIWDHCKTQERQAFCALVSGTRSVAPGLQSLIERGYISDAGHPQPCGDSFAEFVRKRCKTERTMRSDSSKECQPEPALVSPRPPRVSTAGPAQRLALVLGVNHYLHQRSGDYCLSPLRYAERDAEEIADFLRKERFEVWRLLGPQVTLKTIETTFDAIQRATATDPHPDSCFVFYFAGHGLMDPHGVDTAYLVLEDTNPGESASTGLEMTQLIYGFLPRIRVPNTLVLLDACHAGVAAGLNDATLGNRLPNLVQQLFTGLRGRMVLAACTKEAQAREKPSVEHGVFTNYVLRHWRDLDGDHPAGCITFGSLIDYIGHTMPRHHPDVALPVYSGVGLGGTFVLRSLKHHEPHEHAEGMNDETLSGLMSVSGEMRTQKFRDWAGAAQTVLALVFTDIVGSTTLTNELGNEAMNEILRSHFERGRRWLHTHNGYQIKTMGDSLMVAFHTAVEALDFALAFHTDTGDKRVRIRIGLHVGHVHIEEGDAYGAMVNYTARVQARAEQPEIWLSDRAKGDLDEVKAKAHRQLSWTEHPGCVLKGFAGTHRLWSVAAS